MTATTMQDVHVDDEGIRFSSRDDVVVDVTFDGTRVWSFWLQRDTEGRGGDRTIAWPQPLRRFLDGATRLALVDHVADAELYAAEVSFGAGSGRVAVQDRKGRPLGLDKSNRLSRLFVSRDADQVAPLMDAIATVLTALEDCGIEGFLAYGTLLGAYRDGRLIGYDSDADLGYVSRHSHPVDVMLESFALQRTLVEMGFVVTRYSGIAVKVHVPEADGSIRGLDVFGGFMRAGKLYLMGEVGAPFEEDWIFPRTTVELEGRTFAAPAQPDHLLAAMYGDSWRVPDPAYVFTTPESTRLRLNGWFRGIRVGQGRGMGGKDLTPEQPSGFAKWVHADAGADVATIVDLGCGYGTDAVWLGRQGRSTWGMDAHYKSYVRMRKVAEAEELPVRFRWVNLTENRSVLDAAADLAQLAGPRVVTARHVLDAVDGAGRDNLLRLARVLTRGGGALYCQVQVGAERSPQSNGPVTPVDLTDLLDLVSAHGGTVVHREMLNESDAAGADNIARLVVTWK
ncbi:MAG: hypothetical protein H0X12_08335 [Nocardioides sp.]|nr:hypothetical protein [Nocardioides sp.]